MRNNTCASQRGQSPWGARLSFGSAPLILVTTLRLNGRRPERYLNENFSREESCKPPTPILATPTPKPLKPRQSQKAAEILAVAITRRSVLAFNDGEVSSHMYIQSGCRGDSVAL